MFCSRPLPKPPGQATARPLPKLPGQVTARLLPKPPCQTGNAQQEQAVKPVLEHPDVGPLVFAKIGLSDFASVSGTSKSFLTSIENRLKYMRGNRVDWTSLLIALKTGDPAERWHLIDFMFAHWPKTGDIYAKALLIQAQNFVEEFIREKNYQKKMLPYIPGHLDFYNSLYEAGVIYDYVFPLEAFSHEHPAVLKRFEGHAKLRRLRAGEIYELMERGVEMAIRIAKARFPPMTTIDGKESPMMEWDELGPVISVKLAIAYHKDTAYHDALLNHLRQLDKDDPTLYMLMNSRLSTKDIYDITNEWISNEQLYLYPERLLEFMMLRHKDGLHLQSLRDESEGLEYALHLINTHGPHMAAIAVLAGATTATLLKILNKDLLHVPEAMLYPTMLTGRDVELLAAILEKIENKGNICGHLFPISYHIPLKYLEVLFKYDEIAHDYFVMLDGNDYEVRLREALQTFSQEQILNLNNVSIPFFDHRTMFIVYEELFKRQGRKKLIEHLFNQREGRGSLDIFLLSQNLETLEDIHHEFEDTKVVEAIDHAMLVRLSYRE